MTVHISIGNTDNKLTQQEWSRFCREVDGRVTYWAPIVHGAWYSLPNAPWQNAVWAFDPPSDPAALAQLLTALRGAANHYDQDSIAWNESETTFVTPEE